MPDIRDKLKALRDFGTKYEEQQERIARLRSAMEGLNRVMRNAPDSKARPRDHDRLSKLMAELEKAEIELARNILDYERGIRRLQKRMEGLPEPERRVMELRYVRGLKWREVAKKAGYSVDHCFLLHKKAIKRCQ